MANAGSGGLRIRDQSVNMLLRAPTNVGWAHHTDASIGRASCELGFTGRWVGSWLTCPLPPPPAPPAHAMSTPLRHGVVSHCCWNLPSSERSRSVVAALLIMWSRMVPGTVTRGVTYPNKRRSWFEFQLRVVGRWDIAIVKDVGASGREELARTLHGCTQNQANLGSVTAANRRNATGLRRSDTQACQLSLTFKLPSTKPQLR